MVEEEAGAFGWPPAGAPLLRGGGGGRWPHSASAGSTPSSSVNAVSFGFVATAILISMFLVMAIFEKLLLRPGSPDPPSPHPPRHPVRRRGLDLETGLPGKTGFPSPKMTVYASGVSVVMPGDDVPTFIAHPVPVAPHPLNPPIHVLTINADSPS